MKPNTGKIRFGALEDRGFLECSYSPVVGGEPLVLIQITRRGRKLVRANEGSQGWEPLKLKERKREVRDLGQAKAKIHIATPGTVLHQGRVQAGSAAAGSPSSVST